MTLGDERETSKNNFKNRACMTNVSPAKEACAVLRVCNTRTQQSKGVGDYQYVPEFRLLSLLLLVAMGAVSVPVISAVSVSYRGHKRT